MNNVVYTFIRSAAQESSFSPIVTTVVLEPKCLVIFYLAVPG